jgi:NAD(P)-dependent dehydrogenase (short-subunit alcohol dehydrogenase family)
VRRAFVLGGSTHLGGEVVRALVAAGAATAASYRRSPARLQELGCHAVQIDAVDAAGTRRAIAALCETWGAPEVFVHALTVGGPCRLGDISDDAFAALHAVNVHSAFVACQELAGRMGDGGDIVLTATLDGTHPVPAPVHFAATQGALLGMTRALAKELGPRGVRVNLAVLGVLEGGVAAGLPAALVADYKKYSALGRAGTAAEAARAIRWLALENRYMTGQIFPVTGGI